MLPEVKNKDYKNTPIFFHHSSVDLIFIRQGSLGPFWVYDFKVSLIS